MAKLIFRMNQSLDGYVDHLEMPSGPTIFRHWIEQVRNVTGSVYGRRMYEVMRDELLMPVALHAAADDLAFQHV